MLKKQEKGFTIIEVLIVLAIAGLIMLVVFLAVPALNRNSRNTRRRSDVGRVGAAAQEFVNNNNGRTPTAADAAAIQASIGTLSIYVPANVTVAAGAGSTTDANSTVQIRTGTTCDTAGAAVGGAPTRQMTIIYAVEKATPPGIQQCQEI